MKTRLDRRLRLEKEKRKAVRLVRDIWQRPDLAADPAFVGKRARTRVPCSCMFCGNPRRHSHGPGSIPIQERRAALGDA